MLFFLHPFLSDLLASKFFRRLSFVLLCFLFIFFFFSCFSCFSFFLYFLWSGLFCCVLAPGMLAFYLPYLDGSKGTHDNEGTGRCWTVTVQPASGGNIYGSSRATVWEKVPVCLPWDGVGTGRREAIWLTGRDGSP